MTTAAFARAETGTSVAALRRHVVDLTRELDGLRTALDTKLATLEAALKNPGQDESLETLETLVIELARVATAEAEATAARACLQAKLAGEELVQTVRAEAERSVQAERATAGTVRAQLDERQAALDAASESAEALQRDLEALHGALDGERATSGALRQNLEEAGQRISVIERAMEAQVSGIRRELEDARDAALRQISGADAGRQEAIARADAAARERDTLAAQLQASHEAADQRLAVLEAAQRHLEAAARQITEAEGARQEALARAEAAVRDRDALAIERAEIERALRETEVCLDTATHDRDAAKAALEDARKTAKADLDAARDAARAAIAETEKQRDEAVQLASQAAAEAAAQAAARAAAEAAAHATARAAAEAAAQAAAQSAAAPESSTNGPLYPNQPARRASRYALPDLVQVEVDGGPAVLVDLSATGAQLLSPTALKPNRPVKLTLPVNGNPVLCKGKVVWARLEPASKSRPLAYRAGVCFTTADEAAVEAFLVGVQH
jgi:hypothetical protein